MRVITSSRILRSQLKHFRQKGLSVGCVLTMGALHRGHLGLVRVALRENDRTIVTLFVNPLQFAPHEDFDQYPRDISGDLNQLKRAGAHVVFVPRAAALLKSRMLKNEKPSPEARVLCGPLRKGHFQGVVRIVALFFRLIKPDRAYFGQKDYQQYRIIQLMTKRYFGRIPEIRLCPTVRAQDGVALSSRNRYLTRKTRQAARGIPLSLGMGYNLLSAHKPIPVILSKIRKNLTANGIHHIDYAAFSDALSLKPVRHIKTNQESRILLALAVRIAGVRLIDNILIDIHGKRDYVERGLRV